jgi:hypothetical protein
MNTKEKTRDKTEVKRITLKMMEEIITTTDQHYKEFLVKELVRHAELIHERELSELQQENEILWNKIFELNNKIK